MTTSESSESKHGLLKRQEEILVQRARRLIDEQKPADALKLVKQCEYFWTTNLVTIMAVFCSHARKDTEQEALKMFKKHVERCTSPSGLLNAAQWAINSKRSYFLPREFIRMLNERRRALEPTWDGTWEYKTPTDQSKSPLDQCQFPHQVSDPEACLIAASQVLDWSPWLQRYRELGGSFENPRYLKLVVSRAVSWRHGTSPEVRDALKKLSEVGEVPSVKAFIRHITPTRKSLKGKDPSRSLAMYALFIYCGWERLELDIDDWVHVAMSAMYLGHNTLERIAQRGLAGLQRTPRAQQVFVELVRRNGIIPVTERPKMDIGSQGNPIWRSVYQQLPIDSNARRILMAYSHAEIAVS